MNENEGRAPVKKLREKIRMKKVQCRQYEKEIGQYKKKIATIEKQVAQMGILDRWKIGEYLHDSLSQKLIKSKILINFIKKYPSTPAETEELCNVTLKLVEEGLNEVRNLSHDVIPKEVGEEGIVEVFNHLREQIESRHQINCQLKAGEITKKNIPSDIISDLYMIAQEAIKNAVMHGKADKVRIDLFEDKGHQYLLIKDNGKKFDLSSHRDSGLDLMKYWTEEMGGTFRIRQAEKNEEYSTYVSCILPLEKLEGG